MTDRSGRSTTSTLSRLLAHWHADPIIGPNIAAWDHQPARQPVYAPFPENLHPGLISALGRQGITALYSHQIQAWQSVLAGQHTAVVTGTASGKSLCYNLPVLNTLLVNPTARALYLFPTKALAQDQYAALEHLLSFLPQAAGQRIPLGIYSGDTPAGDRPSVRSRARVIFTSPDMLHTGVLPHHTLWKEFFVNLQFVVVDELHIYRGIFGSHMANVLRRLRRICRFYGSQPLFLLASATIANPGELAGKLVEAPVTVIDRDGSARGPHDFIIYNPPVVDRDLGLRRSHTLESVRLAQSLIQAGLQTIIFGRSRRTVELLLNYLREALQGTFHQVHGYRSGYLSTERREIERSLRDGSASAVVATTALELGIDIGGMGAAVLAGYPGTIASARQQAGRAGRATDRALAVLVASPDPLDQFLAHHPDYLFERSPEQALVNPDNLLILLAHLRCSAFELPFNAGEGFGSISPETLAEFLDLLEESGVLHASGNRYFWMADRYPAGDISLRSASPDSVILQAVEDDNRQTVGVVDSPSAPWLVHPGAIYMHEGQTFFVDQLDLEQKTATLLPVNSDYYTEPQVDTAVSLIESTASDVAPGCLKNLGEIKVTTRVTGFRQVRWYTRELLGFGILDLPPTDLITQGFWITISDETVARLDAEGLWTNTENDYGPAWQEIRIQVRARDGYRCQVCGSLEIGRPHHVHHKVPFRTFASALEANRLENLITLCPVCHRKVELNVRIRSGLGGLAYTLGHLAPIFLMCDQADLGVHADPQAPLAGAKPAVVLYDMVPAGIGLCERLFQLHDELLARAGELVSSCACADGCPSCVGPGGENGLGGKRETYALIQALSPVARLGEGL